MKHINDCHGLDHDRCRICGYVPTEHYLNYLKAQIDKAQKQTNREGLQSQLRLATAKHNNHQWTILD